MQGRRVAYLCPSRLTGRSNPEDCGGVEVNRYFVDGTLSPSMTNLVAHFQNSRRIAARIASRATVDVLLGHSPLQYLGSKWGCGRARKCYTVHSPFAAELRSHWSGSPRLSMRAAWTVAKIIEGH